jgi:drug/metabolite transporter (DMT)-like permease
MNKTFLVWMTLCLIWGSTWIFMKLGLRDLPPVTFVGLRFVIAAMALWFYVRLRRQSVPRDGRQWMWIIVTGLIFALNYGLLFWGGQYISSGLSSVLQATIPVFGFLFAHYFIPGERITPAKLTGLAISMLGIAVIFSNQLSFAGRKAVIGSIAVVIGSMATAASNVLAKLHCQHVPPATLAAGQLTVSFVFLLAFGGIFETNLLQLHWTPNAVGCLLYMALVGSATAFILYYWLLQNADITQAFTIALVTPILAVILGMLVLGEQLTWRLSVGSLAVLSGLGLIVKSRAASTA